MSKQRHEPFGRPTKYSPELAERICKLVATNPIGLPKICAMFDDLPSAETIRVWRWEKPDFSAKYTESKQFQAELMAESIEDVIDELSVYEYQDKDGATRLDSGLVARARLTLDARRWTASKLAPKIYGEKRSDEQQNKDLAKDVAERVAEINKQAEKDY